MPDQEPWSETESLCPTCLRRVPARRVARGDEVHLVKRCPNHGEVSCVLWRGAPSYEEWGAARRRLRTLPPAGAGGEDCPFSCGLCAEHRQPTCCALVEVTGRCNLRCPTCFAAAGGDSADPSAEAILRQIEATLARGGPSNVQLSGGEPTLRDDLPEIVARGIALGVPFFQLNTNGIRLARDADYAQRLAEAGLGCVFLQYDGLDDAVHQRIRGAPLAATKERAIERCAEVGLGVVLVPTLIPGVNTHAIGAIVRHAVAHAPTVRGVHFQPVSYFGRYEHAPADGDRITLPEVLRALEEQTAGMVRASHFHAPSAESAHCSWSGAFVLTPDGGLRPATPKPTCCSCKPARSAREEAARSSAQARRYVAARWAHPRAVHAQAGETDALDDFLAKAAQSSFCISGMVFQDVWNIDLGRLRECFLHVVDPGGGGVIPFCAFNLTSASGRALYRGRDAFARSHRC
jgi:hypothetical protein